MRASSIASIACAGLLVACNFTQQGEPPPVRTLNYPMAVALSPRLVDDAGAPRYLYVVNSNFDLRYNTGSLQAIDLEVLQGLIDGCDPAEPCLFAADATVGEGAPLIAAEVGIGSHTVGIFMSPDEGRVYLPVRSKRNLAVVDIVTDGGIAFRCDETSPEGQVIPRCGDGYLAGFDDVATERELTVDGDPIAVTGGRLSDISDLDTDALFILLALRDGRVALFIDDRAPTDAFVTPRLVHVAGGFQPSQVTITLQPGTGVAWMTSAVSQNLDRVGVAVDEADPYRSFLYNFGAVPIAGVDNALDQRDLQFDAADADRAFVLSRRPDSIIDLDLSRPGPAAGSFGLGGVSNVGDGPSRLAVIQQGGETFVLASAYDAKQIFVVGPERGLVAVIGGFSGPFEMAYDAARERLYVTDFTTSQLRVVDMAPLTTPVVDPMTGATSTDPRLIATLGLPVTAGSLTN